MQIRTPGPLVHDGDFEVTLTDGRNPAALIELDRCGEFQLAVESPEDADRLIRAAAAAKELILGARTVLAPVTDEAAVTILARAIKNGTTVIVEDES